MDLLALLKRACSLFEDRNIKFALAGGIIADRYRKEPRATDDIDFVVSIKESELETGREIISSLGYNPAVVTDLMLKGDTRFRRKAKKSIPQMLVGRREKSPYGVDLLLLSLPWAEKALDRAACNLIDFGAGPIPCLTMEDVVISKLYALKNSSTRRYKTSDIPDVALILENNPVIDINYLLDCMTELELVLPGAIEKEAHFRLTRLSRKNRKKFSSLDY